MADTWLGAVNNKDTGHVGDTNSKTELTFLETRGGGGALALGLVIAIVIGLYFVRRADSKRFKKRMAELEELYGTHVRLHHLGGGGHQRHRQRCHSWSSERAADLPSHVVRARARAGDLEAAAAFPPTAPSAGVPSYTTLLQDQEFRNGSFGRPNMSSTRLSSA